MERTILSLVIQNSKLQCWHVRHLKTNVFKLVWWQILIFAVSRFCMILTCIPGPRDMRKPKQCNYSFSVNWDKIWYIFETFESAKAHNSSALQDCHSMEATPLCWWHENKTLWNVGLCSDVYKICFRLCSSIWYYVCWMNSFSDTHIPCVNEKHIGRCFVWLLKWSNVHRYFPPLNLLEELSCLQFWEHKHTLSVELLQELMCLQFQVYKDNFSMELLQELTCFQF